MATYLDAILSYHRRRCMDDSRPLDGLMAHCKVVPAGPSFESALRAPGLGIIAEIKRRSPSRGSMTTTDVVPAEVAGEYCKGGAAAISVLTDTPHFGGELGDLRDVAAVVDVPVLRKDFLLTERDLCDARINGASAALIIASAMDRPALERLIGCSAEIGLELLLEVHDPAEIAGVDLVGLGFHGAIGINQRDLVTFEVDPKRALAYRERLSDVFPVVAESGIQGPADAQVLAAGGYDAILVGEHLMRAGDRAGMVRTLRGY
ncbi:indole-3-glycerol phosphate synthase TrpC [Ferrimicrobium sp.]|uniref:indole-3-glycerol phosphate synthase TrpC n=1 Tax=Ferrimicrobium sp. TaxID=2926050 RepID=UPI002617F478|nr:indole-3-glycerol phosphate synthase TrpC [Ferrimicrobium sp.]